MNTYEQTKKAQERRVIEAARKRSRIIPEGKLTEFAEPDFTVETLNGLVGIEITAVMAPAYSECFSSPLAEQHFRERVVLVAENTYYGTHGAVPVTVSVFFSKIKNGKNDKWAMGRALANFVTENQSQAAPSKTFSWRPDLPDGFGIITITKQRRPWMAFQFLDLNVEQIHRQIAGRISAKNALLPRYRSNLPDSPIMLLLFSGADVSTGVPQTAGMGQLEFHFDFDRVFFFSALDADVIELRRKQI